MEMSHPWALGVSWDLLGSLRFSGLPGRGGPRELWSTPKKIAYFGLGHVKVRQGAPGTLGCPRGPGRPQGTWVFPGVPQGTSRCPKAPWGTVGYFEIP